MENNLSYFQPEISDIRIGYICEKLSCNQYDYISGGYSCKWEDFVVHDMLLSNVKLRTRCLTKEDLEFKGWKINSAYSLTKDGWYIECNLNNIASDSVHIFLEQDKRFDGFIPSINEFNYICKLLKIE